MPHTAPDPRRVGVVALAFLAALACPDASAAGGVKKAKERLAAGAAESLKAFKKTIHLSAGALELGSIDVLHAKIDLGNVSTTDVFSFYGGLETFQVAVKGAYYDAHEQMGGAYWEAMVMLFDAGLDATEYPRGFHYGEAGPLDDFRFGIEKQLTARYAKVRKKLEKLSKRLEKVDIGLNVRLTSPVGSRERAPGLALSTTSHALPLTIDLAVAFSRRGLAGDGRVWVSGTALAQANVTCTIGNGADVSDTYNIIADGSDRWQSAYSQLVEGGYWLRVAPLNEGAAAHTAIGVR